MYFKYYFFLLQGYLLPWRNDQQSPLSEHLPHLFSNLEQIYEFNKSFLEQLKVSSEDATHVANVFLHNDSGFSVYTEYCTNYPRTMDVLGELTRNDNIAALFRERQIKLLHALPLGSYLLKPVQRILKYHLLLQVSFVFLSINKTNKFMNENYRTNYIGTYLCTYLKNFQYELHKNFVLVTIS